MSSVSQDLMIAISLDSFKMGLDKFVEDAKLSVATSHDVYMLLPHFICLSTTSSWETIMRGLFL